MSCFSCLSTGELVPPPVRLVSTAGGGDGSLPEPTPARERLPITKREHAPRLSQALYKVLNGLVSPAMSAVCHDILL